MQEATGEFEGRFTEKIFKFLYDGAYQKCESLYDSIVNSLNTRVSEAPALLGQDLETWNAGAFNIVKGTAENVCIPIAGVIFGIIFAWELVMMVQDHNYKENVGVERVCTILFKLVICLLFCINSFDIVMFLYRIGNWAVTQLGLTTSGTFGMGTALTDVVSAVPERYDFNAFLGIIGVLGMLLIALAICNACGVVIYLQILMWFMEMAIYAAPAPIPFATFFSKDWNQMGMNYAKKGLSTGLRGFFMLLFICIYGGFVNNLPGSTFMEMSTMLCGGGITMIILLGKTSSIADSILNSH